MAFPVPSHLPRKKDADVSTALLTKMSDATAKSLTFELASSWVTELDDAIRQTKRRIHDRVQSDFPAFEQQLSTSKSIQERLKTLSSNVDALSDTLSHSETGMIPNLIKTLSQHASLTQQVSNADVKFTVLSHLSRCKQDVVNLTALADEGRLPEVVDACKELDTVLESLPQPLDKSSVSADLKRKYRSVKDRTQEQLIEAFSRGVVVSQNEIVIRSSIQVRQSATILPLSSIVASLSPSLLSDRLNTLRRDLSTHYVDHVLSQPFSVEVSIQGSESKLVLFPATPLSEDKTSRVDNLTTILNFLANNLFPHLPSDASFPRTLCKPVTTGLLNKLLIPSMPSSLDQLPPYLALLRRAVASEEACLGPLLGDTSPERDIKSWADGISQHYERKRRVELLERARAVVLRGEDDDEQFRAEVMVVPDTPKEPESIPEVAPRSQTAPKEDNTAWGFEDEGGALNDVDEDGWGFEDDATPAEETPEVAPPRPVEPTPAVEEDPDDAWGWKEQEESPIYEPESEDASAWDDPWGDEPAPAAPVASPKAATRLERHAGKVNGTSVVSPLQSPNPIAVPPPTPSAPATFAKPAEPSTLKESYVVSGRVKELMFLVEDILREAEDLASSGLLRSSSSGAGVGSVIGQSAAMVLELYRGLYPVTRADQLSKSAKVSMRFSNDCLWLEEDVGRLSQSPLSASSAARDKLAESQQRLRILGESWFEDIIDNECQNVNDILDSASGFIDTGDQERFDECEASVNNVLQDIRRWSQQVKPVLTKSKYYGAVGAVVDEALCRMLQDVLALSDIPEVESHRLSELCRILGALEALFVEDVEQASFVVAYVPSWLKFSYLSELLEASMADISYLFEEGALVDFEIEELVKLVRALFADTPLRANTVNKLMQGHPVPS
ncbi:hypothetical protein EIP91_005511 [Steccherinum ochraceum]|uniref:ZW10 C-terminal helical domain-containing protein n=1 Tax=Steccherinum ochraceum TaxID=92696 RepID=A0A4R0RXK4_9APHY|nr:hypothetical protein EIP91_005511 [Steccherinum ochraceum]